MNTEQQKGVVIRKLYETQCNAVTVIMEAEKMKETLLNQEGEAPTKSDKSREYKDVNVPYGIIEMMQDRLLEEKMESQNLAHEEKDKMRKNSMKTVLSISICFTIVIAGLLGTFIYFANKTMKFANDFLNSFEFVEYSQDGNGINNFLGSDAKIGDINYEPANTNNPTKEVQTEGDVDK